MRKCVLPFVSFMIALLFSGCGGGGGSIGIGGGGTGGAPSAVLVSGRVTLPPGSPLHLNTLKVSTCTGNFPVASDGTFKASVVDQGLFTIMLMDARSDVLMLGYADTTQPTAAAISPHTTSKSLLFMALGGITLPANQYSNILNLLEKSPQLTALQKTVTARLATDPQALVDSDAQLLAAVQAAHDQMLPPPAALRGRVHPGPLPEISTATITVSRSNKPTSSNGGTQIVIQPSTIQSGVEILQNPNGDGFIARNHFRRHCSFGLFETGFTDASGQQTNLPTALAIGTFQDLPSTQNLNLLNAVTDALTGKAPFSPVDSQPMTVGLDSTPGTTKTFYKVVVFGPTSLIVAPDPPIFSDPQFVDKKDAMHAEIDRLLLVNLVESFIIPILETVGVVDFAVLAEDAPAKFIGSINAGALHNAFKDAKTIADATSAVMGTDGLGGVLSRNASDAINAMIDEKKAFNRKVDAALMARQAPAALQNLAKAGTILKVIDIAFKAFDLGTVVKDLSNSQTAEVWEITAALPTIHLTPSSAVVTDADTIVKFAATVPNSPPNVTFEWQCGKLGVMDDLNGHRGVDIKTSDANVTYERTAFPVRNGQDDTITVTAFDKNGTPLGQRQAEVYGVEVSKVSITPPGSVVSLSFPASVLTAKTDQAAPVIYRWILESSPGGLVGSISDQSGASSSTQLDTTDAKVTYTVVQDDNLTNHFFIDDFQQVSLQVFLDDGSHVVKQGAKPVAKGSAQATVDEEITPANVNIQNLDASEGNLTLGAGPTCTSGTDFSVTATCQNGNGVFVTCSFADPSDIIVDGKHQVGTLASISREDTSPFIALQGAQGFGSGKGSHTFVFHIIPFLVTDFLHEDTFTDLAGRHITQLLGPWVNVDASPAGTSGSLSQQLQVNRDPNLPPRSRPARRG